MHRLLVTKKSSRAARMSVAEGKRSSGFPHGHASVFVSSHDVRQDHPAPLSPRWPPNRRAQPLPMSMSGALVCGPSEGTGPMVLFDKGASVSFVLSPMTQPMAANMVTATICSAPLHWPICLFPSCCPLVSFLLCSRLLRCTPLWLSSSLACLACLGTCSQLPCRTFSMQQMRRVWTHGVA